ncbi:MAG: hypothetical protein KDD94_14675, partial [Calditrichaeota bacterium]|nr:hypothetical protein [Calditrichota bacterium]
CSLIFVNSCGSCDDEQSSVRLINNGSGKADIQVKTSGGNTININNVLVGESSDQKTFAAGNVEFTITIQGANDPLVYNLTVENCKDYLLTIKNDNTISAAITDRD